MVDGLVKSELDFMDPAFTSKMEEELDEVEAGKEERVDLLKRFYKRFRQQLDKSKKLKRWNPEPEPTDEKCDIDGGVMLKRWSKNGWFLGCANYPECKNTRDLGQDGKPTVHKETGIDCDKCGKPMVIRSGRYGEFLSCTGYPECKNAKPGAARRAVPQVRRRPHRDPPEEARREDVLRLLELPERSHQVRLQALAEAHRRAVPDLRGAVPRARRTRTKPMIVCANKECGYKRAVTEPGETVVPAVGGEPVSAAMQ